MKSKQWLWLLIILLLTACAQGGNGNELDEQPPLSQLPNDEFDGGIEDEPSDETGEGVNDDKVSEDEEIGEAIDEPEPESIDIRYYMNGIYDIKPIDPDDEAQVVLLTFDDGPKDESTVSEMLDILDKHEAKAIFFVNGHRIVNNPELLVQIHERGQIIGNHTWQHLSNLPSQPEEVITSEIMDVQDIVEELTGERPVFFRPPHGASNEFMRELVKEDGMLFMTWSASADDWKTEYRTTETIVPRVMEQLRAGSNILMHEQTWTIEALDTLLTTIKEEGYSFVDPRAIHLVQGNPTIEEQP